MNHIRRRQRRGAIYIAVMGVALLVSIMGAVALSIARLDVRTSSSHHDFEEAQILAKSALEFGVNWIADLSDWRATLTHDVESAQEALGNGTLSWKALDADGDLADDPNDAVELIGYGRVGDTVAAQRLLLEPTGEPLTCLETALLCDADLVIPAGSWLSRNKLTSNQMVMSNGNVDASGSYADIDSDVEAAGTITGSITGSTTPAQPVREMPHEHVFEYYLNNGTWIDVSALPLVSGSREIGKVVLSPASNPFGDTNPEGIYVIDCQGEKVRIKASRIVGTVVLWDNDDTSHTWEVLHWEPAVPNYPALMTENGFIFYHSGAWIDEGWQNTNYNPPGTPYEGDEDSDTSDSYPSLISGIVYIGGHMTTQGLDPKMCGVVIAPSMTLSMTATCDYAQTYYDYPPPGFTKGTTMRVVPGSWRRVSAD